MAKYNLRPDFNYDEESARFDAMYGQQPQSQAQAPESQLDNSVMGNLWSGFKQGAVGDVAGGLGGFAKLVGLDSLGEVGTGIQDYVNGGSPSNGYDTSKFKYTDVLNPSSEFWGSGQGARTIGSGVGSLLPLLAGGGAIKAGVGVATKGMELAPQALGTINKVSQALGLGTEMSAQSTGNTYNELLANGDENADSKAWGQFGKELPLNVGSFGLMETLGAFAPNGEKVMKSMMGEKAGSAFKYGAMPMVDGAILGEQSMMSSTIANNTLTGQDNDFNFIPTNMTPEQKLATTTGALTGLGFGLSGRLSENNRMRQAGELERQRMQVEEVPASPLEQDPMIAQKELEDIAHRDNILGLMTDKQKISEFNRLRSLDPELKDSSLRELLKLDNKDDQMAYINTFLKDNFEDVSEPKDIVNKILNQPPKAKVAEPTITEQPIVSETSNPNSLIPVQGEGFKTTPNSPDLNYAKTVDPRVQLINDWKTGKITRDQFKNAYRILQSKETLPPEQSWLDGNTARDTSTPIINKETPTQYTSKDPNQQSLSMQKSLGEILGEEKQQTPKIEVVKNSINKKDTPLPPDKGVLLSAENKVEANSLRAKAYDLVKAIDNKDYATAKTLSRDLGFKKPIPEKEEIRQRFKLEENPIKVETTSKIAQEQSANSNVPAESKKTPTSEARPLKNDSTDLFPDQKTTAETKVNKPMENTGKGLVTEEHISKALPKAKITKIDENRFQAELPNGQKVEVNTNQKITGKNLKKGEKIVGSYSINDKSIPIDHIIKLDKDANQGTVNHEVYHMAEQSVLTEKQIKALEKKFGNEEARAEAYSKWNPEKPNTVFGKINQWAKNFMGNIRPTADTVFNDIKTGKAFKKSAKEPVASDTKYSISHDMKYKEYHFSPNAQKIKANVDLMEKLEKRGWEKENRSDGTIAMKRKDPKSYQSETKPVDGVVAKEDLKKPYAKRFSDAKHEAYSLMVDALHPIKKHIKDVPELKAVHEMATMFPTKQITRAELMLEKGNENTKPLQEIYSKIGEKNLDKFNDYIIAKRTTFLSDKGIKQTLTKAEANKIVLESPPEFEAHRKELVKYQNELLKVLKDGGNISEETYNHLTKTDQFYVPLFKQLDESAVNDISRAKGFVDVQKALHKIGNSQRKVIDPLQSIIKNTYLFHNLAERNKVGQELAKIADVKAYQGFVKQVDEGSSSKKSVFSVMQNGEKKYYQTTPDFYRAITSMDSAGGNMLLRMVSKPAQWLRAGITLSPEFALRNLIKDQFSAYIFAKHGYIPFVDMFHGMRELGAKGKYWQEAMETGVLHTTLHSLDREYTTDKLNKIMKGSAFKRLVDKNPLKVGQALIDLARDLSEFSESSTRIGALRRARINGASLEDASFNVKDLLNYTRAGTLGKDYNKVTAFFNAGVQGIDKFRREMIKNPIATNVKAITAITLPSIFLWTLNHNDDRVKELPQWEKDLFWIIPTKDHLIRIPKPFELGILYGTLPERILSQWLDKDPKAFNHFAKSLKGAFLPNYVPTLALPIIEGMTNYSLFTERQIVPQSQEKLPPYLQYGANTSEVAKSIGKAMDWSPRKVDVFINDWTGTIGKGLIGGVDLALADKEKPATKLTEKPVVKALFETPYKSPQSVQDFYEKMKELETKKAELEVVNGRRGGFKEEGELMRLKKINGLMSKLQKQEQAILADKKLSSADKRSQIDELNIRQLKLAKLGLRES